MLQPSAILPRAAIALAALGLAGAVLCGGAATRLGRIDPARAERWAPYDARASMAAAEATVAAGASVQDPEVRRRVDRALARDATLPTAIEFRALEAGAAGDGGREARLFALSDGISRRSLPTRLWLIQQSVDRGDVAGALEDFDIALRTSSAAPGVLFPVLAGAAADPALAAPIARILDRPEDWRVMFLNYAIAHGHAADIGAVALDMRDRDAITAIGIDQTLVAELLLERRFEQARRIHDAFRPSPARAMLVRDPQFADPAMSFPFGWGLVDKGGIGAERGVIDGRSALSYQSSPDAAGQVAAQLLMLAPGGYRLSVRAAADSASAAYWTLTCDEQGGARIAVLDTPVKAAAQAAVDFTVPPTCAAQWLALNLRPGDIADSGGAVASVFVIDR